MIIRFIANIATKVRLFYVITKKLLAFFRKPTCTSLNLKRSSKTYPSFLTLKEGSTSHLGLLPSGKKRKPLLSIVFTTPSVPLVGDRNVALNRFTIWMADHQRFFLKSTRPSLPLRKAPHLSPSLSLLRRERMC